MIAGSEEADHQVSISDDENMTAISNVKQETTFTEAPPSAMTSDAQTVVASEVEPVTSVSV